MHQSQLNILDDGSINKDNSEFVASRHNRNTALYVVSKLFERASYYGVRALLVLFMTDQVINFDRATAFEVYGWFIAAALLSGIIGACIGDLLLGNRKSIIIGGILQAIGILILCLQTKYAVYVGLSVIFIGNGLYTPNLLSTFGKEYLGKPKLIDGGFIILETAINLGAFIGVALIGYYGEISYNLGFGIAGGMMIVSVLCIVGSKESAYNKVRKMAGENFLKVISAFLLVGLFWAFYRLSALGFLEKSTAFLESGVLDLPFGISRTPDAFVKLLLLLVFSLLWSFLGHFHECQS